jgi:enoyl-CoA hydratase/carnithine racemase
MTRMITQSEIEPVHRERLRRERHGAIAVWTLDRADKKNALDWATLFALDSALDAARYDPVLRAVVLTGAGDSFASGLDLDELRARRSPEQVARLHDLGRRVCDGIAQLRVPVIAALPGPAIGGGAELALACDVRIADPGAALTFKHVRMGVTPGWGTLPKLVAMIGHGAATRLLLVGHDAPAADAHRLGLVDAIAPAGESLATALAWGQDVARGAPIAVAEVKAMLRDALGLSHEQRVRERERFLMTCATDDHGCAIDAFFTRMPPVWQGR